MWWFIFPYLRLLTPGTNSTVWSFFGKQNFLQTREQERETSQFQVCAQVDDWINTSQSKRTWKWCCSVISLYYLQTFWLKQNGLAEVAPGAHRETLLSPPPHLYHAPG